LTSQFLRNDLKFILIFILFNFLNVGLKIASTARRDTATSSKELRVLFPICADNNAGEEEIRKRTS